MAQQGMDADRDARVSELLDELETLLGEDPYVIVTIGRYRSSATTDEEALRLLRDAAQMVLRQKARNWIAGVFGG